MIVYKTKYDKICSLVLFLFSVPVKALLNFICRYDLSVGVPSRELCNRWAAASDSELSEFSTTDLKNLSSLQIRFFLSDALSLEV